MQFCDSYFFLGNINGGYRKPVGRSFIAIETEDEIRERKLERERKRENVIWIFLLLI